MQPSVIDSFGFEQSAIQRDLALQSFEADRNTLKCRCLGAAYGLDSWLLLEEAIDRDQTITRIQAIPG
jgi:hypothetical protein